MEEKYANSKIRAVLNIAVFLDSRFKTDFIGGLT